MLSLTHALYFTRYLFRCLLMDPKNVLGLRPQWLVAISQLTNSTVDSQFTGPHYRVLGQTARKTRSQTFLLLLHVYSLGSNDSLFNGIIACLLAHCLATENISC
jgi:hypothetical protein